LISSRCPPHFRVATPHFIQDTFLAIVSEESKEGMKGSTEEKHDPSSFMDSKRNLDPSKSRAELK
jgi:hypothetical protein